MKLLFFGTSLFVVPVLKALHEQHYDITVVTAPDTPPTRKQSEPTPSPVALVANELGLQALKPVNLSSKTLKACGLELMAAQADIGIVASYGKIIPQSLIDLPKRGLLNIHPSLLPKYRGPTPVPWALLHGDTQTGVTIIQVDSKMDHGDIIAQQAVAIEPDEMYWPLINRLWLVGTDMLISTLPDYLDDKINSTPQDHSKATFSKLLTKDDGKIDWSKTDQEIYNQYRALTPWPGVWFMHNDKRVKITSCHLEDGKLQIFELQPEGKQPMDIKAFENGYGQIQR